MKDLLPYIVDKAEKSALKHEVHSFDSGAMMIDIWVRDHFYVVQIDGDVIGLSEVTEETGWFDVIPDQAFKSAAEFKIAFEKIFV